MIIDAQCLYEAKIENVERLASALGLKLPFSPRKDRTYTRKLIKMVLDHMAKERRADRRRHHHHHQHVYYIS